MIDELGDSGATAPHDPRKARLLAFATETFADEVVVVHRLDERLRRISLELLAATRSVAMARRPT